MDDAITRYRSRLTDSEQRVAELKSRDGMFAMVRLGLFLAGASFLAVTMFTQAGWGGYAIGFALLAGFLVAAVLNEPVREQMQAERCNNETTLRLIGRVERDWDALQWPKIRKKLKTVHLEEHQKDVADDLDLLGKSSLFQFVSMAGTTIGVRTIAQWLTSSADAETALERSDAVKRLAPRHEERFRFYTLAAHVGEGTGDPDEFVRWTKSESWLQQNAWVLTWAKAAGWLSIAGLVGLLLWRYGVLPSVPGQIALVLFLGVAVINVLISTMMLGPVHQIFSIAMASRDSVDAYSELFSAAEWLEGSERRSDGESNEAATPVDRLRRLKDVLIDDPKLSARAGMNSLQRIAAMGSLRTSAATFIPYLVLQFFALWDVRVLKRLEDWKTVYGASAVSWFDALGELEALMSLAAVCEENPSWVFPQWLQQAGATKLESTSIGHPLLRDDERVCNDVAIGPAGTVLLVTGSNMSGKSTMLRSVGLNVSLAGAGAPVCAQQLRLPSIELATSIRVRDNLAEGVSFYMAELHRLKGVVDRARLLDKNDKQVSLFLLDEILQGTNSRERQIAVTQVLQHLMQCGAIGAISTHDLELADEPDLQAVSDIVHFRETIHPGADGKEQMTFDYQMRSGVSPTTNALRLLEIVGLGESTGTSTK